MLGIEKQVRFMGLRKDVHAVLAAMDIFVLPSTEGEGIPQALTQAMAMAVPVVATHIGGMPEVLTHSVTGLLVPPNDPDSLKTHIRLLLKDPSFRVKLGQKGRDAVTEKFGLNTMATRVETWYSHLLEKGRNRHSETSER